MDKKKRESNVSLATFVCVCTKLTFPYENRYSPMRFLLPFCGVRVGIALERDFEVAVWTFYSDMGLAVGHGRLMGVRVEARVNIRSWSEHMMH